MFYFKKLIDIARQDGIVSRIREKKEDEPYGANISRVSVDAFDFYNRVKECHSFVFNHEGTEPKDIGELDEDLIGKVVLDCPFKVFSIEMNRGPVCSPPKDAQLDVYIWATMVIERGPADYIIFNLCEVINPETSGTRWFVIYDRSMTQVVQDLIDRMNRQELAIESVRLPVTMKDKDGKKYTHRIRRIIHVCGKKYQESYAQSVGHEIQWTHRWFVRGHWRKLPDDKLGKDREGNYCIKGNTWVTEYEKGPEDLPLVKKVRIVE